MYVSCIDLLEKALHKVHTCIAQQTHLTTQLSVLLISRQDDYIATQTLKI